MANNPLQQKAVCLVVQFMCVDALLRLHQSPHQLAQSQRNDKTVHVAPKIPAASIQGVASTQSDSHFAPPCGHECSSEFVEADIAPVTIMTIAFNVPDTLLSWLHWNRRREAQAFGYEFCIYTNPACLPGEERASAWAKVAAVRSLLAAGRKAVVVLDGDAIITNLRPFEPIVEPHFSSGKSIIFSKDCDNRGLWGGPEILGGLNTGVFVTKNDIWAQAFWKRIWESKVDDSWWEQSAVLHYQKNMPDDFASHTVRLDTHAMNSCNRTYDQNDFIFHAYDMYGKSLSERLAYMQTRFGSAR